ncbi:hypothetical protein MITS9509_00071 [Synechococcus sp. MIT S9509]|nr:hypothetical protein MITS9504_01394 [Synechococcus sp. MIT S9504]KZR93485.1 hypothetical protein MITS9509_00071 [Synechococcus sp. MIT S9509]
MVYADLQQDADELPGEGAATGLQAESPDAPLISPGNPSNKPN